MKKRIISAILCTALAAVSIVSTAAVETDSDYSSRITLNDFLYDYRILSETTLPNNFATFYTFGSNIDPTSGISLEDPNTSQTVFTYYFNSSSPAGVSQYLPSTSGYKLNNLLGTGSSSGGRLLRFSDAGGTYQKIRLKLSAFSSYFNEDGTYTKSFFNGEPHDYNFTKEATGGYSSSLVFFSGSAITAVAPDRNGMAEIYVSTKLGAVTFFTTDFSRDTTTSHSSGGGTTGTQLYGFTIGDVDKDGDVDLADGILVQKSLLSMATFDDLAKRNADANRDGNVNLLDSIKIQKYLLKMD